MPSKTTPITRFSRDGETTYNPPEDLAAVCKNRVRIPYTTTPVPACSYGHGRWNECGDCPAKPGRPCMVITAPQGSGKTTYAELLAKRFGCNVITDSWEGHEPVPPGTLALTCTPPDERSLRGDLEITADTRAALEALAAAVGD